MSLSLAQAVFSDDPDAVRLALAASQRKHDEAAEQIRASVGNPPLTKRCKTHPGQDRLFSSTDSAAARVACYGPCPDCRHERDVLAPKFRAWCSQGLPKIYFGVKLDDLDFAEVERTALDEFNRDRIGVLALLGNAGTGKTSVACAILQTRNSGHYTTRADVLSKLRASYISERGGPSGDGLKRRLIDARMLVLDEFEKTDGGGDGQRLLFEIIDGRYSAGLPTIVCGNCSLGDFKGIIGGPGYSRVTGSSGTVLEFTGHDHRPGGKLHYKQQVALIRRLEKMGED